MLRRTGLLTLVSMMVALYAAAGPSLATQFRSGSVISVRDAEILDDVIAAGDDLSFDSHILGDVIAAGRTVTVGDSALIDNSFMAFGQKVDVNGTVINSARVFAQDFTLRGHVERNVMGFAQSILIDSRAWVEKDLSFACAQLILRGRVGGNLSGGAGTITISGQIDGDAKVEGDKIVVLQGAIIGGSLKYRSKNEAKIEDGAQILGGVERLTDKDDTDKGYTFGSFLWDAWWYVSSLALGIVIILLFRGFTLDVSSTINSAGLKSLGLGLLFLICMPIGAVAVALTLVGIPVAIFIALLWVVLLYLSEIYVGLALGEWLRGRLRRDARPRPILSLAVGLLIITMLSTIPFVGMLIGLGVCALAMGGFFIITYNRRAKAPA